MGRASRKKNRWRGQGGLYSRPIWDYQKSDSGFAIHRRAISKLRRGENIQLADGRIVKSEIELQEMFSSKMSKQLLAKVRDGGSLEFIKAEYITGIYFLYLGLNNSPLHHYFISSKEVMEFLKTTRIKDEDIEKIKYIITSIVPIQDISKNGTEQYDGVLHMLEEKYSIIFTLTHNPEDKGMTLAYERGNPDGTEDIAWMPHESGNPEKQVKEKYDIENWRILLNMFLYIDAFPDAIKKGPPPVNISKDKRYLSHTTIGCAKAIEGLFSGRSISAHLRRGHFRFLQSPRYKKKRYQTVYVHPSMVKGNADHIINKEAVS